MKLRKLHYLSTVVSITLLSITGCVSHQAGTLEQTKTDNDKVVTFEQLKLDYDKYEGESITITGYLFWGWEWLFLSEDYEFMEKHDSTEEGYYKNVGDKIDIFGIEEDIKPKLYRQHLSGAGDYIGKVSITGKLKSGPLPMNRHGYFIELVPDGVEVLTWTPPIWPLANNTEN